MANCCVIKLPFIQLFLGFYSAFAHLIALYLSNNAVRYGDYYRRSWNSYSRHDDQYYSIDAYVHHAPTAALNLSAGLICGLSLMICGRINQKFDSTSRKYIKGTVLSNIFSIALSIVMIYFSIKIYDIEERVFSFLALFWTIYVAIIIGIITQIIFLIVSNKTRHWGRLSILNYASFFRSCHGGQLIQRLLTKTLNSQTSLQLQ